jgi:histidine ammonia-lyase
MTVTLSSRKDFHLENARRVAFTGEGVAIAPAAKNAMAAARRSFMAYLDSDRTRFIYGTTSGAGQRAHEAVPPAEQRQRAQDNRRVPHGAGFGPDALPERVVRLIVFARLANYIEGNAKARPVEAERIATMLERPMPRVPLSGQVGAGEILPLFHVMSHMPDGDVEEAEPMARMNGSPVSAALAADAALTARNRLALAAKVFALSVEAYRAPLAAYDAALVAYSANPHERRALTALRRWLEGADEAGRLDYQAPVSWRILPTVLAATEEAVAVLEEVARTSLASITDNPVYALPDRTHPLGRVLSTGGYHNAQATPAIDTVNARWSDLCTLADRHTMKLHDADHLPESLAKPGGHPWGTTLLSFVQVGYGEEARHAARRTFMPLSEGGGIGGQNDVASATMLAYKKHLTASFCIDAALVLLAVSASQALWATDREPAPPLRPLLELVRSLVPPVVQRAERDLGHEILALQERFSLASIGGELP